MRPLRKWWHGGGDHRCTICCSQVKRFRPYGLLKPRNNAQCPVCGCLERHRLIWLYLERKTDLLDGRTKKLLHVAPEQQIALRFQSVPGVDYLSGDLSAHKAMVQMDITDIQYPADTFDIVYCSHVLEHVPDDRRAMSELCRVLKPGGWAILQVPLSSRPTFEDFTATTPQQRERLFGQHDHVRIYGPDYQDRLVAAGFEVTVDTFAAELGEGERIRYGINPKEEIYCCRKRAAALRPPVDSRSVRKAA